MSSEEFVECDMCGEKIPEDEAHWVRGDPYCTECYREAEVLYGDY